MVWLDDARKAQKVEMLVLHRIFEVRRVIDSEWSMMGTLNASVAILFLQPAHVFAIRVNRD